MDGSFGMLVCAAAARDPASRRGATGLAGRLDLARYRRIMADSTWDFVEQATIATRSYETGLEAGFLLLRFTEEHRADFAPTTFEDNMMRLYYFVLDMLDRLDQWDAYLDAWAQIRTNTNYAIPERPDAPVAAMGMAPFILRRDPDAIWVHFLWELVYRKAVIERKVQARRQGRRLGNLLHHPQDELSDHERRRRVERVAHNVRTMWSWTTHPSGDEQTCDSTAADTPPPSPVGRSITRSLDEPELVGALLRLERDAATEHVWLGAGMSPLACERSPRADWHGSWAP